MAPMANRAAKAATPMSAPRNRPHADGGFTLVEAMTALMLIGLLVGAVVLMVPGPDRTTRDFAAQLGARLAQASDESIIANKPIALAISDEGYGFMRLEENGWLRLSQRGALSFRAWPEGADVQVEASGAPANEDVRIAHFDALGGSTPARLLIRNGSAAWRISIGGQGDVDVAPAQ